MSTSSVRSCSSASWSSSAISVGEITVDGSEGHSAPENALLQIDMTAGSPEPLGLDSSRLRSVASRISHDTNYSQIPQGASTAERSSIGHDSRLLFPWSETRGDTASTLASIKDYLPSQAARSARSLRYTILTNLTWEKIEEKFTALLETLREIDLAQQTQLERALEDYRLLFGCYLAQRDGRRCVGAEYLEDPSGPVRLICNVEQCWHVCSFDRKCPQSLRWFTPSSCDPLLKDEKDGFVQLCIQCGHHAENHQWTRGYCIHSRLRIEPWRALIPASSHYM